MIRLFPVFLFLAPLLAQGQQLTVSAEVGRFGYLSQYSSGRIERYSIRAYGERGLVNSSITAGLNVRLSAPGTPAFVQAGLRYSFINHSLLFTDEQPGVRPLPAVNPALVGAGFGLDQYEMPLFIGARIGNERALHLDLFGGFTPALNFYNRSNRGDASEWYRPPIYESLNRVSLATSAGATLRYNRWGVSGIYDRSFTSLNGDIVYQNVSQPFTMTYQAMRVVLSYQFIKPKGQP